MNKHQKVRAVQRTVLIAMSILLLGGKSTFVQKSQQEAPDKSA